MADSGNPTLAAANEATDIEPLNAGPTEPQPPKQEPSITDNFPSSLQDLHSPYEPVVFPLDLGSRTKNNQSLSADSLPTTNEFEQLVKSTARPEGPNRAEEISVQEFGHEDVVQKVKSVAAEGKVKAFRLMKSTKEADLYVVGLDLDGERLVGVKVVDVHTR